MANNHTYSSKKERDDDELIQRYTLKALQLEHFKYDTTDPVSRQERLGNVSKLSQELLHEKFRGVHAHEMITMFMLTCVRLMDENNQLGNELYSQREELSEWRRIQYNKTLEGPKELFEEFETLCKLMK